MGEIADGLIDGTFDSYTGEYLGRGPGYPRTASRSLPWEQASMQRSNSADLRRAVTLVYTTMSQRGIKGKATRKKMIEAFCQRYVKDALAAGADIPTLCFLILHHPGALGDFKTFINNQKQKNAPSNIQGTK